MFWPGNPKQTRNIWKTYRNVKNGDYITGNLLYYLYHQNYYKLISIDLSRQANANIRQQINFVGKLEERDIATMLFYCWKATKTI